MVRTQYQLLKDNEPIALGSMTHCLDMFYWEIYYGCDHLAYNIAIFRQDEEVYQKAKAWDLLKVELKRKLDMESERLRRANRNLEDDDSKEYIIGKITGQNVELMNVMTTISDMERADDER